MDYNGGSPECTGRKHDDQKLLFMDELRTLQQACLGPWCILGDFYRAADKNNSNIDCAMMGRFRRLINELQLKEVELLGRRITWSNERSAPTLVRLNRVLCTLEWENEFPNQLLQSMVAGISDHCPLLLTLQNNLQGRRRFHFECF